MSNPCEDCNRLQEKPIGSATPRPKYHQPTKYDHLESFSKFKESKALLRKLKTTQEELLKLNPKFTNFQLEKKKEGVFENVSTQSIAKILSSVEGSRFSCKSESTEIEDLWQKQYEFKPSTSSGTISRSPIYCPISKCGKPTGATTILSHLFRDHNDELVVQFRSLYINSRSIWAFYHRIFNFGENICMAILTYGGVESEIESRPATRGICMKNLILTESKSNLENHLPILVMACKTSICAMLKDRDLAKEIMDPEDETRHVLVIWLATFQTTKPIFCTITAFDESMTSSRSTIVQVRSLESHQTPDEFLSADTNYLMLQQGELNILSEQQQKRIYLEIQIQEFDERTHL